MGQKCVMQQENEVSFIGLSGVLHLGLNRNTFDELSGKASECYWILQRRLFKNMLYLYHNAIEACIEFLVTGTVRFSVMPKFGENSTNYAIQVI